MNGTQFKRGLLDRLKTSHEAEVSVLGADPLVRGANEEELWGALACLDEYPDLERLKLERKIRVVLQQKELKEDRKHRRMMDRRYWAPLIVGILSLILGALIGALRCSSR